jgi:hypothetical protein
MGKAAETKARPSAPERAEFCDYWELSWREYFADAYPPFGNRPAPIYQPDGEQLTSESAHGQAAYAADEAEYRRQERLCRERFSAPFVQMPAGWEGWAWREEFTTLNSLREYLEEQLNRLCELGIGDHLEFFKKRALQDALEAWRNAWRVFRHLGTQNPPERGDDPQDEFAAERKLMDLIDWLRRNECGSVDGPTGDVPQEPSTGGDDTPNRELEAAPPGSAAAGAPHVTEDKLLEKLTAAQAKHGNTRLRLIFIVSESASDGLLAHIPPEVVHPDWKAAGVAPNLNIGGDAAMHFTRLGVSLFGVGAGNLTIGNRKIGVHCVLQCIVGNDEQTLAAVASFREIGSEAGAAIHSQGIVAFESGDSPLVMWALTIYAVLHKTAWLQPLPHSGAFAVQPFAASIEAWRVLAKQSERSSASPSVDEPNQSAENKSPNTLGELLAWLERVAADLQPIKDQPVGDGGVLHLPVGRSTHDSGKPTTPIRLHKPYPGYLFLTELRGHVDRLCAVELAVEFWRTFPDSNLNKVQDLLLAMRWLDDRLRKVEADKPDWSKGKKELRYKGRLVKRFRNTAKNQFLVLDSFSEQGWRDTIDDPLPRGGKKEVDAVGRVQETAKALNDGMEADSPIRFSTNGSGTGFTWSVTA